MVLWDTGPVEAGLTGNAVPEGIYHYSVSDLALTLGTMDMAGSGRDRGGEVD